MNAEWVGFGLCEAGNETLWEKNHDGWFQLYVKTREGPRMFLKEYLALDLQVCSSCLMWREDVAAINCVTNNQSWKNDTEEKEPQRIRMWLRGLVPVALGFPGVRAEWGTDCSCMMVKRHLKEFRGDKGIVAFWLCLNGTLLNRTWRGYLLNLIHLKKAGIPFLCFLEQNETFNFNLPFVLYHLEVPAFEIFSPWPWVLAISQLSFLPNPLHSSETLT